MIFPGSVYEFEGNYLLCESIGIYLGKFRMLDENKNRILLKRMETDLVILSIDKFLKLKLK